MIRSRAVAVLVLAALLPASPRAQETAPSGPAAHIEIANPAGSPPPEEVTLNLKNADIQALISAVSDLTGKNFVVDPRVQATVTVISARPTSRAALYDVFLSVLKVHGFTAIESGQVIKILPEATAKQEGGGDVYAALPPTGPPDDLVTMVLTLRNTDAPSMIGAIQPFASPTGHLTAHAAGNTMVVSDTRANVDRLVGIVERIDQAISTEIEVIRLQNAAAGDVASTLNALGGGGGGGAGVPGVPVPAGGGQVVADERTNSLLLGGPANQRLRLRALISHLDTPIEAIGPEVVYLRYAKAIDLAPLLTSIATGAAGTGGAAGGGALPPLPVPGGGPVGGGGAGGAIGGEVRIQADENTNALIIQAPPEALAGIKSIIRQLDIRRAQVYVEGVIAEVSDLTSRELGVQWQSDPAEPGAFGVGRFPVAGDPSIVGLARTGAAAASGLTLGYLTAGSFQALIRVLGTDAYNNLLSTPTLVTMDNEEAEILVGQNVPFVTGQFTPPAGTVQGPFQTIERQDVGVKLKLTPQINEGDSILLTLEQEVSNVVPGVVAAADITTSKRSIKTTVLVDNGQTLVIGGLTDDNLTENVSKVPLLGDLPLIGNIFRNKTEATTKRSLMVFLRTTIVRDQRTGTQISARKYNHLRDLQLERTDDPVWPGFRREGAPLLPSLEDGLIELPDP